MEKRIGTLEKQLRLYRRVGILALCLMAGALIAGAVKPAPKVIEAEKFVLRDAEGKRRGQWGVDERGPRFRLFDKHGKRRVDLKIAGGSGLYLFDSKERFRAAVTVASFRPGGGGLENPGILLKDESGKMRMLLSFILSPALTLYDSSESERAALRVGSNGVAILEFEDHNEKTIWRAPPK